MLPKRSAKISSSGNGSCVAERLSSKGTILSTAEYLGTKLSDRQLDCIMGSLNMENGSDSLSPSISERHAFLKSF